MFLVSAFASSPSLAYSLPFSPSSLRYWNSNHDLWIYQAHSRLTGVSHHSQLSVKFFKWKPLVAVELREYDLMHSKHGREVLTLHRYNIDRYRLYTSSPSAQERLKQETHQFEDRLVYMVNSRTVSVTSQDLPQSKTKQQTPLDLSCYWTTIGFIQICSLMWIEKSFCRLETCSNNAFVMQWYREKRMLEDSEFVCQQHSVAQVEDDIEEGFSDQSESPLILR